ncbi:DUF6081 family protein [Micromonospora sp. C95]|uniref:DUF6081 family protein n=1 Tax=Micromonospora sp. C95 TaxID=2824882 RepID=UPI001B38D8E0|nr:DUF6081 family protein [Micromonospora sp. C95]MBQ1023703.1 hypothetical protein [Micromonospora sp. C95]
MSATPSPTAWTYDDFTTPALDPDRWEILRVSGNDGVRHAYQDRNARLHCGDGAFEMSIVPFSRFHDTSPIQNNAKQMYRSTQRFLAPAEGELRFEVNMAVRTYGQVPYDLLDAFGTVNVFDLETGVVFNVAATNDSVYAVVERLALPGIDEPGEPYVHRVVLDVPTEPGREHHYAIAYRAETSEAAWYVDGKRAYWARIPVPVSGFHAGMALFSARDLTRYTRAEREHGQGATARWSGWTIDGCVSTVR